MPMFNDKKRSEVMMERANEMQVGAARRENLKGAVANTAAMMEGSKAMGIARARQDLAAKAVKGNKKRKNRPIGPIIL